jgi:hypothetical protein
MAFLLASIKFTVDAKWRRLEHKKLPGLIYTNRPGSSAADQTFIGSLATFNIFNQYVMKKMLQTVQLLKEKLGQAVIDSTLLLTGLLKA